MAIKVLVGKIMTKNPLTIDRNETVLKAAQYMSKKRVGCVIVVDNKKPVGILTDTDLTKRIVATARDPAKTKVGDVMSTPLIFVKPDDDYTVVVEKMKKHKIKRIPVLDKGKIVGILTTTDIARTVPEMIDILEARMEMKTSEPSIEESSTSGICEICGNYSDNLTFENDQWVCENCTD